THHQLILRVMEVFARATQVAHGAITELFSFFTRCFSRLLQHTFRFVQTILDALDEFLFMLTNVFLSHITPPVVMNCMIVRWDSRRQAPYPRSQSAPKTRCAFVWYRRFYRLHRPVRG